MTKTVIEYSTELDTIEENVRSFQRMIDVAKGYAEGAYNEPDYIPERNNLMTFKARNEAQRLISELENHISKLKKIIK